MTTTKTETQKEAVVLKEQAITREQYDALVAAGLSTDGYKIHDPNEEARKRKVSSILERAKTVATDLTNALEFLDEYALFNTVGRMASNAFWAHNFNRRMGEREQLKLDNPDGTRHSPVLSALSSELDAMDEGHVTWERIQQFFANADNQHVLHQACVFIQGDLLRAAKRENEYLFESMRDRVITDTIDEQSYIKWCDDDAKRYQQRRVQNEQSSVQATRMTYATTEYK